MGLSLFALGATLIFIGALSFREILLQETTLKKALGWILGFVFVIAGIAMIVVDVKAEDKVKMCVYYTMTQETKCMPPTSAEGCATTIHWFEKEASWHNKNRYCCVDLYTDPNKCQTP